MNKHEIEIVLRAIERGASDVWWVDGTGSGMEVGGDTKTYIAVFFEGAEYCRWYYDVMPNRSSWDESTTMFCGPDHLLQGVKHQIKYLHLSGLA